MRQSPEGPGGGDGQRSRSQRDPGPCGVNRNCAMWVGSSVLTLPFHWALFLLLCRQEGSHWVMCPSFQFKPASSAPCRTGRSMVSWLSSLRGGPDTGFLSFHFFPRSRIFKRLEQRDGLWVWSARATHFLGQYCILLPSS